MNEKTTISFKEKLGFRVNNEIDITTGKVIINGIEITSVEDWDKVTHSIVELQERIEKTIEYLHETSEIGLGELSVYGDSVNPFELEKILKGEKE